MKKFSISKTFISGLVEIERQKLSDTRGFLARLFCADEFALFGWHKPIAQINLTSTTRKGCLRGMHFQFPPHAEMKLVNCLRGEVWDVAVDIRTDSPTFLCWHGVYLSAENCKALLIPPGFAHGFQTITDEVDMLYCHSVAHAVGYEGGLNPCDPQLAIPWPMPITEMSDRDKSHPLITSDFKGVGP